MPTQEGWRHISLIINGERASGFANETPPVEFPSITLNEISRGPDGTMHSMMTGVKGGPVVMKFQSDSPFVGILLRWNARILNDEVLDFSGTYANARTNFQCELRGGVMMECPAAEVPGETFEVTFEFEELVPNADRFTGSSVPGTLP